MNKINPKAKWKAWTSRSLSPTVERVRKIRTFEQLLQTTGLFLENCLYACCSLHSHKTIEKTPTCTCTFFIVRSRLLGFGPQRHPSHAYFARMLNRNRARPGGVQEENIFFGLYVPLGGHPSHAYFSTHA